MTMEIMKSTFGSGGSGITVQGPGGLRRILAELRGFKIKVVQGVDAAATIIFPGIRTTDTIAFVIGIDGDAAQADSVKDFTSNVSISAMHRLLAGSVSMANYMLIVGYYDKDETAATTTTTTTTTTTSTTTTTTSTTSTTSSSTTTTTTTTSTTTTTTA